MNVYWTPYAASTVAAVVASDRIMIQFGRSYLVDPFNRGFPPENLWLGGMSGCPLFALWDTPLVHVQLAGVGIEFNENIEIARFSPISRLTNTGALRKDGTD